MRISRALLLKFWSWMRTSTKTRRTPQRHRQVMFIQNQSLKVCIREAEKSLAAPNVRIFLRKTEIRQNWNQTKLKSDKTEIHYNPKYLCNPCFETCKRLFSKRNSNSRGLQGCQWGHGTYLVADECLPLHGGMPSGEFPNGVDSKVQYGQMTWTFYTLLNLDGVDAKKAASFINSITGFKMSERTVINTIESCAKNSSALQKK